VLIGQIRSCEVAAYSSGSEKQSVMHTPKYKITKVHNSAPLRHR